MDKLQKIQKASNRIIIAILLILLITVPSLFYWRFVKANPGAISNATIEPGTQIEIYDYVIWYETGAFYAKDGELGIITTHPDKATLIQQCINSLSDTGGTIYLKEIYYSGELSFTYDDLKIIQYVNGKTVQIDNIMSDYLSRTYECFDVHYDNRTTNTYLSSKIASTVNYWAEWIIRPALDMYYVLGDTTYLDIAKIAANQFYGNRSAQDLPRYCDHTQARVTGEVWRIMEIVECLVELAQIDPTNYVSKLETIVGALWTHGMVKAKNLFYYSLQSDGTHTDANGFIAYYLGSWSVAKMWFCTWLLTQNVTYLDWTARAIKGAWDIKGGVNLLPHYFNAETGNVIGGNEFIKHGEGYGDGLMTLAWIIDHGCDRHTYDGTTVNFRDILTTFYDAGLVYIWNSGNARSDYTTRYDTGATVSAQGETYWYAYDVGMLMASYTLNNMTGVRYAILNMKNHYDALVDVYGRLAHGTVTNTDQRLLGWNLAYIQSAYIFYLYMGQKQFYDNAEALRSQLDTWRNNSTRRYYHKFSTATGLDQTYAERYHFWRIIQAYQMLENKASLRYIPHFGSNQIWAFCAVIDGHPYVEP